MMVRTFPMLLLLLAATAAAEDDKAKAAREELERQLNQLVGKQPAKVRLDFVAFDEPNYQLEEALFELDGRALETPSLSQLSGEGTHLLWNGEVAAGKHQIKVRLVISNTASVVVSDEGGHRWKIGGATSFEVQAGIEVRVRVTPKRDGSHTDVAKRFKLTLPAEPVMIAQLDDGTMPAKLPAPTLDAGEDLALATPPAGERSKVEEPAAEGRGQPTGEPVRVREVGAEGRGSERLAALDAKKRKAGNAQPSDLALSEAGIGAQEVAPASLDQSLAGTVPAPLDAGIDGTSARAAPAPDEEAGPPWVWMGIAGGLAALAFLVLVARRRARVPRLDD